MAAALTACGPTVDLQPRLARTARLARLATARARVGPVTRDGEPMAKLGMRGRRTGGAGPGLGGMRGVRHGRMDSWRQRV